MKRMGVPNLTVRPLPAIVFPAARSGPVPTGFGPRDGGDLRLDFSGAPKSLRFLEPPGPSADAMSPRFTQVRLHSSVLKTEADILTLLDHAANEERRLRSLVPRTQRERALIAGELDVIRKITVSLGYGPGSHIKHPSPKDVDVPSLWISILRWVLNTLYLANIPADEATPMPPLETNAGFPTYQSSFSGQLLSAACLDDTIESSHAFAAELAPAWGMPAQCALAYAYNTRAGPTDKFMPLWRWTGGGWEAAEEVRSGWCRRRQVWMGSKPPMMMTRQLLRLLKASRRRIRGLWHAGSDDDRIVASMHRLRARGAAMFESDISSYDASVPRSLQEVVAAEMRRRWPHLSLAVDAWLFAEGLPCIYPSYLTRGGLGSASLVTKRGETSSGQLLTAEIGTLINLVTVLYAVTKATGLDARTLLHDGDLELLVQGDDVLLAAFGVEPAAFEAAYKDLGLTARALQGWRFLSKHRLPEGPRPVAGRVVQQTWFNEHEPTGPDAEPLLALGMEARWGLGPPADLGLADWASEMCAHTFFFRERGWRSVGNCIDWVGTSEGRAAIGEALAKRANAAWLQRLLRDAPHSPSAAAQLDALLAMGFVIEQPGLAQGWAAMDHVTTLSRARRRELLLAASRVMLDGEGPTLAVVTKFMGPLPAMTAKLGTSLITTGASEDVPDEAEVA